MSWNAIAQVGNPTKSIEVNELIKAIKKEEGRKQGKPSSARRALTHQEFIRIIEILKAEDQDDYHRCGLPGLLVTQYNLIARIDDTCQFLAENLTDTHEFDFALRSKLNWSKNVHEEREAPNQILVGAMEHVASSDRPCLRCLRSQCSRHENHRIINQLKRDRQTGNLHRSLQILSFII